MKEWLLKIVGVAFLGVMLDILYPQGKTSAFCKSIFGILSVVIIISPLIGINIDSITEDDYVSSDILDNIKDMQVDNMCLSAEEGLKALGINGVNVELDTRIENNEIVIENVYVDTTNLVLTDDVTNINKYEVVGREIANILNIDMERVIVYG